MGLLVVFGLTLTIVAIFFAPMARVRSSQISTLLVVMSLLLAGEAAAGTLAINLIQYGNPLTSQQTGYLVTAVILFTGTLSGIFLMATAVQLTPESENRSTPVRVMLMIHQMVVVGIAAYATALGFEIAWVTLLAMTAHMMVMWSVAGAMMAAEAPTMTPRIRRELPGTFLGRLFLIWFTPGPATGYVFAIVNLVAGALVMNQIFDQVLRLPDARTIGPSSASNRMVVMLSISYLCVGMAGVRVIITILRARNTVRVGVGMAAMAVVMLLMAIVPYSIGLHWNDYRQYPYSLWQITNWVWTLQLASSNNLPKIALWFVVFMGCLAFAVHLLLLGRIVLPQRLVTPKRVLEERKRMQKNPSEPPELIDPLGLGTDAEPV